MLTEFGKILLFFIIGIVFVGIGILAAKIVRPSNPTKEKLTTYECGEEPIGLSWVKFNVRFYVIALIFLIFEVEVVFLFPWALVFKPLGWFAFIEMIVFVVILLAGLFYVWAKGDLEWDKPKPYIPKLKDLIITKK
ncbi:MAG TPA: NADH-quinone oxidoreductase subunit A [Bacteroidota bacterium]|jgi:NADH-quinone oxidoreductase subunit A|nr:NADH-quinone oxidoreductase subunit A [Bacteroidota bacterium]